MATGWTWDYVWETMTFQKLEAFCRIWEKNPPLHVSSAQIATMMKAYFGVGDKDTGDSRAPAMPGFLTQPDIED